MPKSKADNLLLASWNIANLGVQKRSKSARIVIAHILKRFDLIAAQEINDNYRIFTAIMKAMGKKFDFVMSDTAGNDERLAFIYNTSKVLPSNLFGEIARDPGNIPSEMSKCITARIDKTKYKYSKTLDIRPSIAIPS